MKRKSVRRLPFVLIIDNYDSFTFNLYQNISVLDTKCRVYRNDQLDLKQIKELKPDGIVISPGPGNPDSAGISMNVIKEFSGELPILGVCLGHQAIAQVFGGKVIRARRAMHGKTSQIHHNKKGIYERVVNPFTATRYHSLIVEKDSLPSCLEITAESEDGTIMGIKHRKFNLVGVQFHPESMMTIEGTALLKNFVKGIK